MALDISNTHSNENSNTSTTPQKFSKIKDDPNERESSASSSNGLLVTTILMLLQDTTQVRLVMQLL